MIKILADASGWDFWWEGAGGGRRYRSGTVEESVEPLEGRASALRAESPLPEALNFKEESYRTL